MTFDTRTISAESARIRREYRRRERELAADLYAPWQPAENFMLAERKAAAALLLHEAKKFPAAGDKALEIGYGKIGWLADLISWRLRETDLHGIELDATRAAEARAALPHADLRVGDAADLPWPDENFDLAIVSTVFSSILDPGVRKLIAAETARVLRPGGALVWYDLAVDNPRNPQVKGIDRARLKKLFPGFDAAIKRVTLAPPLARFWAPKSRLVTTLLSSIKPLRTHLLAILVKK